MKVTLSEIKKNLQETNSGVDEAKNQVNDLEHNEEKSTQSEQQEEKRIQKKEREREYSPPPGVLHSLLFCSQQLPVILPSPSKTYRI